MKKNFTPSAIKRETIIDLKPYGNKIFARMSSFGTKTVLILMLTVIGWRNSANAQPPAQAYIATVQPEITNQIFLTYLLNSPINGNNDNVVTFAEANPYSGAINIVGLGINNLTNEQYFTKRPAGYPGVGIWTSDGRSIVATFSFKL